MKLENLNCVKLSCTGAGGPFTGTKFELLGELDFPKYYLLDR